ncbi:YcxB family protein [Clostridium sp. LIBA-8841]|uniref:YcxB family protein n=1 Tax=Clostridium sp. LIBA-8841 TaxID=2987530 RepID=UPI002AC732E4|nr:YcxB family protein [Clostridium sp. LIBA-8841]MDZ5254688.1 YcxB family protein [Clostridium sp. LIBA-8841]
MLEFILGKNEFVKCRKEFISREFFIWILFEILGAVFVFVMTMVFIKASKNLNNSFYAITLLAWLIFSIICNIKNRKIIEESINEKVNFLESKNMFGKCTVEVMSHGLKIKYNEGIEERMYPWKIIREISSFRGNIYIFISSIDYISIPQEAFRNSEERVSFLNKINNDRNNVRERILSIIGLA